MSNKTSEVVVFEYTGIESPKDVPKDVTIVRFHSSVTEVRHDMFGFRDMKEVVLNEGLLKIGYHSFYYCESLEYITLPSTVKEIDGYSFQNCFSLKNVVFNEGLQTIGENAFHSCQLKYVNLSEGLKAIGEFAFAHCTSLENVTIPYTVTEIGRNTFYNCQRLREVVLHEGLQSIGTGAFEGCSLEYITFPSTVTDIGSYTFHNCIRLREVGLHEEIQMIASDAFNGCSSLERFTFPNLSNRLNTIINDGKYANVANKIDDIRDPVEKRGSELFISDKRLVQGRNWDTLKSVFGRIDRLIAYYEVKEATTLFELAIWKSKIDQAQVKHVNNNRDVYLIDIPGPVKNTILQYLNFRV